MSRLNLTTDTGAISVSLGNSAAVVDIQPPPSQPESGPKLAVNKELICEGGTVRLSANYNTYRVPVNAATTVTLDASDISGDCSFTLILDAEGPTYPITLPDNFSWAVSGMALGGHRVHVVDVTYNDTIEAFSGDYIGAAIVPVDMDGVVVRRRAINLGGDLEPVEELCALEHNNLTLDTFVGYEDDEGNRWEYTYDYDVSVGPKGVVYGTLGCYDAAGGGSGTIELSLNGGTINSIQHDGAETTLTITSGHLGSANFGISSNNTVIMHGGTISRWLALSECTCAVSISDGYVHSISMSSYASGSVNISGGTIGSVYCTVCDSDMVCNITGGTVGAVCTEDCPDMPLSIQGTAHVSEISWSLCARFSIGGDATVDVVRAGEESSVTVSGGTVGEFYAGGSWEYTNLNMSGGTVGTLYVATPQSCGGVNVTGGYIGSIENSPQHPGVMQEPAIPGPFSNCTIGKISTYPSSTTELEFEADAIIPTIGANVTVERFEFLVPYSDGYTYGTIDVGANSIVKLAPSAQAYHTAGALVINADPTAQIINLEN